MGLVRDASMMVMVGVPDTEQKGLASRFFFSLGPRLSLYPLFSRCFDFDGWKLAESDGDLRFEKDGATLLLDRYHAYMMLVEMMEWEKFYLPKFSLEGKTVLDVGAGTGETAMFYFNHGAKKVIAIECDPSMERYLKANREANHWDMDIIMEPFKLGHLGIERDFLKMDIEGGEASLVNPADFDLGSCVIEMHPTLIGVHTRDWLVEHYGLKLIHGALYGHD